MSFLKTVLVVEDDLVDAKTVIRAFASLSDRTVVTHREDGEDALDYLETCSELPKLILLDINMPRMNGLEFLEIIKNKDEFKMIPVVILSTSEAESDRTRSFRSGISGYMTKPVDSTKFEEMLKVIVTYWETSQLPSEN